ncbi:hypothetical protein CTAYLR_008561 [Chrysophaeum taylorii]|uniref:MYND-type domain-containing protein n=1 Tax=Chrysophaeum taylorii TaxID=2483200 RepID=A0AAD7U7C1_9STRA|nr:hypothetical protein CTAYLR_008561 [Chrysophaeum taylorii]
MDRPCEACGTPARKRCAKCLASYYCSADCQRAAYGSHNELCVWRRTRDVAIRDATGGKTQLCVNYFRVAADGSVSRGQFDLRRGAPSLDTRAYDMLTAGTVVLHLRNTKTGDRAALLGLQDEGSGATTWLAFDVIDVFKDPARWVQHTSSLLLDHHARLRRPEKKKKKKAAAAAAAVLPKLLDALKAHCCEEGEDEIHL